MGPHHFGAGAHAHAAEDTAAIRVIDLEPGLGEAVFRGQFSNDLGPRGASASISSSTRRRACMTFSEGFCTMRPASTGKVQEFTSLVSGPAPTSTKQRRQWPVGLSSSW